MAGDGGPVTLRGIAEQLGLHVSTVSRVLNGPSGEQARAASGETARRIRELADELGYRPNPHATSLRTRRSNLVGVLFPRLSEIVVATIYEGVEEEATLRGLSTFVTNTHDDPTIQRERIAMVLGRRVDGLIIGDAHLDGAALTDPGPGGEGLRSTGPGGKSLRGTGPGGKSLRGTSPGGTGPGLGGAPFVLVNRRTDAGHPAVTCDDHLGGRLVAEHFLALGHRQVAVIAGEPFASTGTDRTSGFVDRYREAGLPLPTHRVRHCPFDTTGGHRAAVDLLSGSDRPTAIFAVNDLAAIGTIGAARDLGLRLGEDLALAGFNDTPLAAELPVPLTSVHSPMAEQGRRAVRLLLRRIAGEPVASEALRPDLVVRASTGTAIGPSLL
ncbi:substrate-binding domain-containing protein [Streptomyces sp. RY43-2]|uniref:Substrate-binding domain-containing protein n=1 Tax=Streptomyces macrolidinus TaxID=2952607 RepID=A0ABT0ZJF3_9ACTN|nr:substrate-binding domain-containing protein [Streptomyces macrolidinus]MCN9243723.1 substrate-binding domain-containing protein [Streptomyces macrolidinus]